MVTTSISNNPTDSSNEAILSSSDGFTAFSFGGYQIRFRAPYSLEEEYIDLKPILDDLYIDPESFLKPIKKVRIAYA